MADEKNRTEQDIQALESKIIRLKLMKNVLSERIKHKTCPLSPAKVTPGGKLHGILSKRSDILNRNNGLSDLKGAYSTCLDIVLKSMEETLHSFLTVPENSTAIADFTDSQQKEQYKSYGLLLSSCKTRQAKPSDEMSRKVLSSIAAHYSLSDAGKKTVSEYVHKAMGLSHTMLTLLPPTIIFQPQFYNEALHDTNRATWDEEREETPNVRVTHYRPVLLYGNHLHVAVKGLVGNDRELNMSLPYMVIPTATTSSHTAVITSPSISGDISKTLVNFIASTQSHSSQQSVTVEDTLLPIASTAKPKKSITGHPSPSRSLPLHTTPTSREVPHLNSSRDPPQAIASLLVEPIDSRSTEYSEPVTRMPSTASLIINLTATSNAHNSKLPRPQQHTPLAVHVTPPNNVPTSIERTAVTGQAHPVKSHPQGIPITHTPNMAGHILPTRPPDSSNNVSTSMTTRKLPQAHLARSSSDQYSLQRTPVIRSRNTSTTPTSMSRQQNKKPRSTDQFIKQVQAPKPATPIRSNCPSAVVISKVKDTSYNGRRNNISTNSRDEKSFVLPPKGKRPPTPPRRMYLRSTRTTHDSLTDRELPKHSPTTYNSRQSHISLPKDGRPSPSPNANRGKLYSTGHHTSNQRMTGTASPVSIRSTNTRISPSYSPIPYTGTNSITIASRESDRPSIRKEQKPATPTQNKHGIFPTPQSSSRLPKLPTKVTDVHTLRSGTKVEPSKKTTVYKGGAVTKEVLPNKPKIAHSSDKVNTASKNTTRHSPGRSSSSSCPAKVIPRVRDSAYGYR